MDHETLEQAYQTARKRLTTMRRQVPDTPANGTSSITRTDLADLEFALDKLQTAHIVVQRQSSQALAAQHVLEQERQHYQELFDLAPQPYIVTNTTGTILQANHAAVALLAEERRNGESWLADRPLAAFVPLTDRAGFRAQLAQMVRTANHQSWQFRLSRSEGDLVTVSAAVTPVCGLHGQVTGLRWLLQLVTARGEATRNLQDSERQEFLSMLSHQLRTPLTIVKGRAQLLARRLQRMGPRDEGDASAVRAALDDFQLGLDTLEHQINGLFDLSRIDAGAFQLHRKPVELETLLNEVVAKAAELWPDRPVRVELPEAPVVGQWDQVRLEQALLQLLDNSFRYSPQASRTLVRALAEGPHLRLEIMDQGNGIPQDDIPQIFDRHFRAGNVGAAVAGLGLGLYLTRQIVERHGGQVWLTSQEGYGTKVCLLLPLDLPEPETSVLT